MNSKEMFNIFKNRISVREFNQNKINLNFKNEIIDIINSSPTSINGHGFSAILIDDPKIKKQLSLLNSYQKQINECDLFVVFLMDDFNIKTCELLTNIKTDSYFNSEIVLSSVIDATIAATMVQDYALLNYYKTCFIGALRYDVMNVQKILKLPIDVIPLVGLCIGVSKVETSFIKPKLNKVNINVYSSEFLVKNSEEYNNDLKDYFKSRNLNVIYAKHMIKHYSKDCKNKTEKLLDSLYNPLIKYWFNR